MLKRVALSMAVVVTATLGFVDANAVAVGYGSGEVTIPASPLPSSGTIAVSGSGFASRRTGATIQILLCTDPGGSAANLPKDNSGCDGSTINSIAIVPTADGSFAAKYPIQPTNAHTGFQITCDASHYCVLWVGEDYVSHFLGTSTQPVGFSAPFLIGAGGNPVGAGTSGFPLAATVGIPLLVIAAGGGAYLLWRRRREVSARR
jgi:hypothetical protein